MNIFDYIQQCGKCSTECGWEWKLAYTILDTEQKYRIAGYVTNPYGTKSLYRWTIDGEVEHPESNNGLNLVPIIPIISYKRVDKNKLSEYNKAAEFVKAMLDA